MNRKIVSICICMLVCLTAIIGIIPKTTKVEATPCSEPGNVGLNYILIYNITEVLSKIVFGTNGLNHGIQMGRWFGTPGERHAANLTKNWMDRFAKYYIDNNKMEELPTKEQIDLNNKMEVTSFSLTLHKGDCEAVISNNECYLAPRWSVLNQASYSGENIKVERISPGRGGLEEYESLFNISYRLFNSSNVSFYGELTYISNYSNASENETYMKVHLINCSDDEFNETVNLVNNSNGFAFILMRDNISNISNWDLPIPGLAVSTENGSLLYNMTQNNSIVVGVFTPYDSPIPENGNLTIYSCSTDPILDDDKFFLVNLSDQDMLTMVRMLNRHVKGAIVTDILYDETHWMGVPNGLEYLIVWNQFLFKEHYYSCLLKPQYYVNYTIHCNNNHNHKIFEWYDEEGTLYADYSGTQQKENPACYNVYCTVEGRDHSKRVIISGGHLDGMWGQMAIDDPIGVAIMLGILKYMNDSRIIPKYDTTFIAFCGEEWIDRGSRDWVIEHILEGDLNPSTVLMMINLDVLAYKNCTTLDVKCCKKNDESGAYDIYKIVDNITKSTNYDGIINVIPRHSSFTTPHNDAFPFWMQGIPFIEFGEQQYRAIQHKTGHDHTKGDVMSELDYNDLNYTTDTVWNVTKYYCVNPNCWFSNVTYAAIDSPDDGDGLHDSIKANFTINSAIPNDLVMVELRYNKYGNPPANETYAFTNYTVKSGKRTAELVFTIPDQYAKGNFSIYLRGYNSTGRINKIVFWTNEYNATTASSNPFNLYHSFGYTKVGSYTKGVESNITGSVFTANENNTADSITAYVRVVCTNPPGPPEYKCMIYRKNDSMLIGTTEAWTPVSGRGSTPDSIWVTLNFTGLKPALTKDTEYVLTIWGNNSNAKIRYDNFLFSRGRYNDSDYGIPPTYPTFTIENRLYSIYCNYAKPQINNVTENPHTVGFGYNVTISTDVTAPGSYVDIVKVCIDYPNDETGNYTMTHISGNTYQYIFNTTWQTGQYNYIIWASDIYNNSNSSSEHHFHVSAAATIGIATLKDSYNGNQYINITDPPNPPENYTLVGRGLTWNTYYNDSTGENILEAYQGPVNYKEDNGMWMPINNSLNQLTSDHPAYNYGYRTGDDCGLFGVYFKSNAQNDWPVAFTYNRSDNPTTHVIRSKLVGVGYVDPQSNWAYQYLQNVQSSQGQTNGNSITYEDVFTGTDVTWSYGNTGLKEEIMLSNATKTVLQNHPPSQYGLNDASSYLVFITKLDHQNLDIWNASGKLTGNVTISDAGVDFKDALGQFKCALPLGEAYELNNESMRQKLTYRIIHLNGNTYLLSGL
ncbi:MAG: M28 family peptidase, partial [Thermoplasmata archaeon]|nr:M28 family peptidase [Thermoplasmata archaeon]